MPYVAAVPAVGLLAGAAFGLLLPDIPHVILYLALIASGGLSVWAWRTARPRLLAAAIVAGFFAGGALLAADAWQRAWRPSLRVAFEQLARDARANAAAEKRRLPEDDEAFAVVEGVLRSDASLSASGVSLSVEVDALRGQSRPSRPVTGGIIVTVVGSLAAERLENWRAGRRVRFPVQLRRTSRYLDPGVPDHERALARRGTTLVGTVKSGGLVELLARGGRIDEAMGRARALSRHAIADAVGRWNPQSGAIVAAIVIGDRAGLDEDVQRRLQEAGTYHVIAISGGNIAILAGLLLGAFRVAGWLGRTAMVSSIVVLVAYAQFVGGGASVDRATLMAVVYFGARAVDQRSPPLNALALVAALLVASDPLSVTDPAFVLTFGATLAILVIVPVMTQEETAKSAEIAKQKNGSAVAAFSAVPSLLWTMFAASAAAEALLFPVGAIVFSRVTFAGLGLNFLAIPLMGVAQIAGMVVVPIAIVSPRAAAAVGWIAHIGAAGLVWSADLVRFAPALTYRLAQPSWIAVAAYYGAAVTLWFCLARPSAGARGSGAAPGSVGAPGSVAMRGSVVARGFSRATPPIAALIAIISALWILVDPRTLVSRGDGRLHLTFLDVGQGDSIFVVFPRGATLLVDAGGLSSSSSFDIGDRVVAPVIRSAGFRRIDLVALSHGDPDHIGGAASIVREFRPREVWEGIPVPRFAPLTALRLAAQAAGARWANVYADDRIWIDEVEIVARHPEPADWERQKVRNDDSIVLDLRWRDVSVLLTGDIGRAVERGLASTIPPARLRVLKIPHHGSLTSSSPEFLAALRPRIAVVSAGRSNHFGHPVPEVLDRYRAIGTAIFRTDQDGAVQMDTDGKSIDIQTVTGRTLTLQ
jgi:competence protein ComEC